MSGAKMQKTKDTMQIFLRSLPLGTLFNVSRVNPFLIVLTKMKIVGFGTNFVSLFSEGSKEYDDSTLALASKHV